MRSSLHRTAAISLDVEKALDSVWRDGLRYKLYSTGLPDSALRFLSSFLQNRSIQVRVNGILSQPVPLLAGTPQESVISPLLFNIYVSDLSLESCQGCRGTICGRHFSVDGSEDGWDAPCSTSENSRSCDELVCKMASTVKSG